MKNQNGYIALISCIIIAFILLAATVTLGGKGVAGRLALLDLEYKTVSDAAAHGCLHIAIAGVMNDAGYTVVPESPTILPVGNSTCTIVSITPNTPIINQSRIRVRAETHGATTNIERIVDAITGEIIVTQELPTF